MLSISKNRFFLPPQTLIVGLAFAVSFLFAGCGAAPINRAKIAKTQTPVSELKNELPQQTAKIAQNSPKRTQKILEAKDPESTELVFAEAYESMTRGEWQNGITLFDDALKSGFLNDGARAIAYWNLYYAHNQLKRDDACLEAWVNRLKRE